MELPEKIKEIPTPRFSDFKEGDKRKKRVKLGRILVFIFILLITFSIIKKSKLILNLDLGYKKGAIVSPLPDLSFEDKLREKLLKINLKPESYFYINESDIEVGFQGNLKVIISKTKSLESQLTSLQLIVKRFRIEGRRIKKIDLRFKNPVIE